MLDSLGIDHTPYLVDDSVVQVDTSLETGIIDLGSANDRTGQAWHDKSLGVNYGDGSRYEHEEDYGITKVPSRQDR
jgi:hypothetical protein